MSPAASAVLFWLAAMPPAPTGPATGPILTDVPDKPDTNARYVVYVHGRILEQQGREAVSPDFGRYQYDAILAALAARGFVVIAQLRSPGADDAFVDKVVGQLRRLQQAGVPSANVTVAGFSKGGGLTVEIAAARADPRVNYVLMAGCSAEPQWVERWAGIQGRVLSLYDASDRFQPSCGPLFARARGLRQKQETVLHTGLDHGLFYAPREVWLEPLAEWATGKR